MLLAKHGVLDALTKVLAKIQELQPENPLEVKWHRNIRMMTSLTLIFSHTVPSYKSRCFTRPTRHHSRPRKQAERCQPGNYAFAEGSRSL